MLSEESLYLAKKMSQDHTKRFLDDDWKPEAQFQLPVFEKVNAVLICKVREHLEVESNAVMVVEIVKGLLPEQFPSLLYHNRGYELPGKRLD